MHRERLLMVVIVALLVGFGLLLYHSYIRQPQVVVARAFQLVDDTGRIRAIIGISPEGMAAITLYDSQNHERATIGVLPAGEPKIVLRERDYRPVWAAP